MENKDIVIIALIILVIYLAYQQTQQKSLPIQPNSQEIQDLKQQINHYQTLYQKRVEKDLEADQSEKIKKLTLTNQQLTSNSDQTTEKSQLFEQKIKDQDAALINLARRKIKGKKEAGKILSELETK